ncbi:uncharacterized protein LOC114294678 isoform X1 [Camellia sinensis]|uniref:uncharacterized protein LOC114294678 isoform X1 n=1 Tax=Camellia sinensis TaxID=4442 RepID=UPI001036C2C2|nr:uncharacterized protein LOC114294678 isoform X1 [Camellia sinensis]
MNLHMIGDLAYNSLASLPCGIIQAGSDLELKPLWSTSSSREKVDVSSSHNLLAIPVGITQKSNVDVIIRKEGLSPLNFYIEDEFHRATRGGAGGMFIGAFGFENSLVLIKWSSYQFLIWVIFPFDSSRPT